MEANGIAQLIENGGEELLQRARGITTAMDALDFLLELYEADIYLEDAFAAILDASLDLGDEAAPVDMFKSFRACGLLEGYDCPGMHGPQLATTHPGVYNHFPF